MGSIGARRHTLTTLLDENPKIETAIERAFRKANLIGEDADLYEVIYSYKTLQNLSQEDIELIYDYLAERLGF